MPRHPLTNSEIQKYYRNEPKFKGISLRNNLLKIKLGAYIVNLDKLDKPLTTYWIVLYDNVTYIDSFEVLYVPKEIKTFIDDKPSQQI